MLSPYLPLSSRDIVSALEVALGAFVCQHWVKFEKHKNSVHGSPLLHVIVAEISSVILSFKSFLVFRSSLLKYKYLKEK